MAIRLGRRSLAAAAVLLSAAAVISLIAVGGGDEDAEAEQAAVPTMRLERRNLAERVSVEGALGYADEAEVIDRLSGTVTWLPSEGAVIRRGERLFEIDDEPVLLMYGDLPAYRELAEGTSGADVKALEANLAELDFDAGGGMTVDDDYTSATASAVSEWQDSLGLDQTGTVELGRVVFQPGPRRVSSLDVSLGGDAGSAGAGSTEVDATVGGVSTMLVAARTSEDEEPENPVDEKPEKDPANPKPGGKKDPASGQDGGDEDDAELQEQPSQSSESGTPESATQESGAAEAAAVSLQVMTTTSVRRQVSVKLDPDQVSAAKRGARALVRLPDGDEVKGRIATVATVAESSADSADQSSGDSGTESATIEVTISLEGRAGASGLDQAPVDVELTEDVRRDVFAVPVEALIGTSGGEYAIVVADESGRRRIAVEPGLFADGYVEIEGEGLESGLAVEVPEG